MDISIKIPTIETERLILRGFEERDLDGFVQIWGDEENAKFIGGVKTRSVGWRHMASVMGHWNMRGFGAFCIAEKTNDKCIGWVGPWEPEGWPEPEIAYALIAKQHGKGYASEAVKASLHFVYKELGWTTAMSLIDPSNFASQNVSKKLGAVKEQSAVQVTNFVADIWRHLPPEQFLEQHA